MIVGTGTGTTTIAPEKRAGYAHSAEGKNYDVVEISFSMAFGNTAASTYAGFEVLDEDDEVIVTLMSSKWSGINSSKNTFSLAVGADITEQTGNNTSWGQKTDFTLIFNYLTKKITCKTNNNSTGKTIDMDESKPLVSKFVLKSENSYKNDTRQPFFSNLVITNTEGDYSATVVDYTINYKDGDNIVKKVAGEGAVDDVVTADAVIDGTETGFIGNHYLIEANAAPSMTLVDGDNVLNVPVRAPYTATLSVTKSFDGEDQTPVETNLIETDDKVCSWSFSYSKYEKKDDTYYLCDETDFVQSGTFANGETVEKTISYTSDPSVVAFAEIGNNGTNAAYSGGAYTAVNSQMANCTLDAGVYVAEIKVISNGSSGTNHRKESVMVGGNAVGTTDNSDKLFEFPFTVTDDNTEVYIKGNGSSNYTDNLDYVIIKKLPATVSVTISDAGYATFSSEYALDFSKATSGLEAYMITGHSGNAITKTQVTGTVPASTGLLLKGDEGDYDIPVVAGSSTDVSANLMKAGTGASVSAESGKTKYVLGVNNNDTAGDTSDDFAEFQKIVSTPATVPTGKAYLQFNEVISVKSLSFIDDGNATGVDAPVAAEAEEDGIYYNLNGQQVTKDYKGIVIKNGKKFFNK